MNFKEKYKNEIDSVSFKGNFAQETLALIQQEAERNEKDYMIKRKKLKTLVVIAALILVLSLSAFAITYLLSASEVAERVGADELATKFSTQGTENQSISNGEYTVTLLGITNGSNIYVIESEEILESRTYAVFSVEKTDGSPLTLLDGCPIQLTPVIEGYAPWAVWAAGLSKSGLEENGILYYLFDFTDLEIFADRNVSIAVFEGEFPTAEIFTFTEDGKTEYAEGYSGFEGMFPLSMDSSKADPEAAQELMSGF